MHRGVFDPRVCEEERSDNNDNGIKPLGEKFCRHYHVCLPTEFCEKHFRVVGSFVISGNSKIFIIDAS